MTSRTYGIWITAGPGGGEAASEREGSREKRRGTADDCSISIAFLIHREDSLSGPPLNPSVIHLKHPHTSPNASSSNP
jgi:hypothetical protein